MEAYRDVAKDLSAGGLIMNFFSFKPQTPEEIETLEECREVTLLNTF